MKFSGIFHTIHVWRIKHIPPRQFLLILSFVVGLISGLAAVLLKSAIHYIHKLLTGWIEVGSGSLWYLAFPILGIILTALFVRFVLRDDISHGITRILFSISKKNSILKFHNNYSSMIASAITIGSGGSVGSEAPIVLTGASMGSSLGKWLRLSYKERTLLLGCGAAGAIAGIFQAPLAGVVFTLEVLMLDLTLSSIVPLLISAVTGTMMAFFLMGKSVLFSFVLKEAYTLNDIPFYILLGIVTGLVSFYFTRTTLFVESKISSIKRTSGKVLTGGLILGVLIFLFPSLYGEGYGSISALLNGQESQVVEKSIFYSIYESRNLFLAYLGLIILFKVVAMAATTGAGGVGGIFAPTLFTGGFVGYFFAKLLNGLPFFNFSESNFTLVGMSGLMAGVMHAPLTGIFLIAEITGGYGLLMPLIITSTISYLTIMAFEPHSIYTKRLARRGELITHDKDKAVLTLMNWKKEIEKDFTRVKPDDRLKKLVKVVSKSKRNIFPVITEEQDLIGVVTLDNIREIMFQHEMYENTLVEDLMVIPPVLVSVDDNMEIILRKFKETVAWNLPVTDNGKYIGFISKSRIFAAYRKVLVDVT